MPKSKIAYITLLDQYHPGIYDSQVIDVVKYWNQIGYDTRLYAFLSIRELLRSNAKQEIKQQLPNARVLPAFPKLRWFRLTRFLLATIMWLDGPKTIVARNVFACTIALWCRKWGVAHKVILDARSAIAAEIREFDVFPVPFLRKNSASLEQRAVLNANYRLAVSEAMVQYWRDQYGYHDTKQVVVPSTLSQQHENVALSIQDPNSSISVVYAGSNAPWQGLDIIDSFLNTHSQVKCTLLTRKNKSTQQMQDKYGDRLEVKWVSSEEVMKEISKHDYGLLLRPYYDTNKVASPGKFAEYLSAGCQIICSDQIGDYPEFILNHQCGLVWNHKDKLELTKNLDEDRAKNQGLAKEYFHKSSPKNHQAYLQLLNG